MHSFAGMLLDVGEPGPNVCDSQSVSVRHHKIQKIFDLLLKDRSSVTS